MSTLDIQVSLFILPALVRHVEQALRRYRMLGRRMGVWLAPRVAAI